MLQRTFGAAFEFLVRRSASCLQRCVLLRNPKPAGKLSIQCHDRRTHCRLTTAATGATLFSACRRYWRRRVMALMSAKVLIRSKECPRNEILCSSAEPFGARVHPDVPAAAGRRRRWRCRLGGHFNARLTHGHMMFAERFRRLSTFCAAGFQHWRGMLIVCYLERHSMFVT